MMGRVWMSAAVLLLSIAASHGWAQPAPENPEPAAARGKPTSAVAGQPPGLAVETPGQNGRSDPNCDSTGPSPEGARSTDPRADRARCRKLFDSDIATAPIGEVRKVTHHTAVIGGRPAITAVWWVTLRTSPIGAVAISLSNSLRQRARSARGSVLRAPSADGPDWSQLGSERPFCPGVSTATPGGWPDMAEVGLPRAAGGVSGAGWAQPWEAAISSSDTAADIQARVVMSVLELKKPAAL